MLRKKILRSVTAQCRNSSSGSRRNLSSCSSSNVSSFLIKGTGVTLGWGSGYLMFGGKVAECEEKRQKSVRDILGDDLKIEDLRDKMWPELRRLMWLRKAWYTSGLRKDLESIRCNFWKQLSSDGWEEEIILPKEEEDQNDIWINAIAVENNKRARSRTS